MTEMPTIASERVDDIPLLLAQMRRMDLPTLVDSYFVTHGNRQGLSLGWTVTVWSNSGENVNLISITSLLRNRYSGRRSPVRAGPHKLGFPLPSATLVSVLLAPVVWAEAGVANAVINAANINRTARL